MQHKCNRLDARETPSGRGIVMEAFSATLERRLQFTVRTLSGILIITFYSNIRLGRNWRRWKDDKKCCQLTTRSIWKERFSHPEGPAENSIILFGQEKLGPSGRPKTPVRVRVRVPQTPFFTQNRVS
jgi:hypothetical protein